MFKFVVLCAFLGAAKAEPSALIAPLAYSANVVARAPAIYASSPSSVVYSSPIISSPIAYSASYGFPHLIKKRSALGLSAYIAPTTYAAAPLINTYAGPLATSYVSPLATSYAAPLATTLSGPLATTYTSPLYTTAHLIKKRSAALIVPSTYIAPTTYTAPLVASTYSAGPIVSTPYIAPASFGYTGHFIKKRSAPLAVAAYTAPIAYSQQSRVDYQATSPAIATYSTFGSPLAYSRPVGITHLI